VILVMAFVDTWSNCEAAGSFQTRPAFATAGIAPSLPSVALPDASARDLVGGCGKGRVRDPQTRGCRGPADIR
jgi:hypothetical protein